MRKVEYLKTSYTIEAVNPREGLGGQHCGITIMNIVAKCDDLQIEIKVSPHRSQHKNIELATQLMQLAIDETIRL